MGAVPRSRGGRWRGRRTGEGGRAARLFRAAPLPGTSRAAACRGARWAGESAGGAGLARSGATRRAEAENGSVRPRNQAWTHGSAAGVPPRLSSGKIRRQGFAPMDSGMGARRRGRRPSIRPIVGEIRAVPTRHEGRAPSPALVRGAAGPCCGVSQPRLSRARQGGCCRPRATGWRHSATRVAASPAQGVERAHFPQPDRFPPGLKMP